MPGTTQFLSTISPKRLMHAGWYAWGLGAGGTGGFPIDAIVWWKYLEHESEDEWASVFPPNNNATGDTLFWHVNVGIQFELTVFM